MNDTELEWAIPQVLGAARLPVISWCATCDRQLTMEYGIGPLNHLGRHPDHYVIQVEGQLRVWRPQQQEEGR
jgi:hypothetical protein